MMKKTYIIIAMIFLSALVNMLPALEDGWVLHVDEPLYIYPANFINALAKLKGYSEFIYNPAKLDARHVLKPPSGPNPSFQDLYGPDSVAKTWGTGQWGQGMFARYCAPTCYHDYLSNDGIINGNPGDYAGWYNSGNRYWGGRPMIRDSARRILAYIYLYKYYTATSQKTEAKQCLQYVKQGMKYLTGQQRTVKGSKYCGTFINWQQRYVPDVINVADVNSVSDSLLNFMSDRDGVPVYENAQAIMALAEGYAFLKDMDPSDSYLKNYYKNITLAADFLMTDKHDLYNSINYRSFYLLALLSAYRVTDDSKYLTMAVEIYLNYIRQSALSARDGTIYSPQREDGVWRVGLGNNYHDTYPFYTGIILWGLETLYDALPESAVLNLNGVSYHSKILRENLATNIFKTINHFLEKVPTVNDSTLRVRLIQSGPDAGKVISYYGSKDYSGLQYGNELAIALYYGIRCENSPFDDHDKQEISKFYDFLVWGIINGINNSSKIPPNSDVQFQVLAMQAYRGPIFQTTAAKPAKVFFTLKPHKK